MSDKYIIKNCPVNYGLYKEMCGFVEEPEDIGRKCADCTDCLLKQIVEKCKDELGCVRTIGKDIMAEEILKLLDIQECDK